MRSATALLPAFNDQILEDFGTYTEISQYQKFVSLKSATPNQREPMPAYEKPFTIEQNAGWQIQLTYADQNKVPIPLTGETNYIVRFQINDTRATTTKKLYAIDSRGGELSDGTGTITLDTPSPGGITITIPEADTSNFDWLTAVYDALIKPPAAIAKRILQGNLKLSIGLAKITL